MRGGRIALSCERDGDALHAAVLSLIDALGIVELRRWGRGEHGGCSGRLHAHPRRQSADRGDVDALCGEGMCDEYDREKEREKEGESNSKRNQIKPTRKKHATASVFESILAP
jgi:hypothetical protein